jgi:hypothetical protein
MEQSQTQSEKTYSIGRKSGYKEAEEISFKELEEKFQSLQGFKESGINSVYHGEQTDSLRQLEGIGFKPLAWTPNVRYHYYNPDEDLLIKWIEGDLFLIENPTEKTIEEEIRAYPKAEVCHGEKYDSRFDDSKVVLGNNPQDARDTLKELLDEAVTEFEKKHEITLKGTGFREYQESERRYSEEFKADGLIEANANIKGLSFNTGGRIYVTIEDKTDIVHKGNVNIHLMFKTTINQSGETETLGESKGIMAEYNLQNQEWNNLRFNPI